MYKIEEERKTTLSTVRGLIDQAVADEVPPEEIAQRFGLEVVETADQRPPDEDSFAYVLARLDIKSEGRSFEEIARFWDCSHAIIPGRIAVYVSPPGSDEHRILHVGEITEDHQVISKWGSVYKHPVEWLPTEYGDYVYSLNPHHMDSRLPSLLARTTQALGDLFNGG